MKRKTYSFETLDGDEEIVERRLRELRDLHNARIFLVSAVNLTKRRATYRVRRLLHDVLLALPRLRSRYMRRGRRRRAPRALTRSSVPPPPRPWCRGVASRRPPSWPPAVLLLRARIPFPAAPPAPVVPPVPVPVPAVAVVPLRWGALHLRLRLRLGGVLRAVWERRGREGGAGRGVGALRNAVAHALTSFHPGVGVVVTVPPGGEAGAEGEPEEAGGGAAAAVHVSPVVRIHRGE